MSGTPLHATRGNLMKKTSVCLPITAVSILTLSLLFPSLGFCGKTPSLNALIKDCNGIFLSKPEACATAGDIYYANWNNHAAKPLYQKACEKNVSAGCVGLGLVYRDASKYEKAFELFKKACDMGDSSGCMQVGICYNLGIGALTDVKKAFDFFKLSCEKGNANGCDSLAEMYLEGRGVDKNETAATKFYKKSCEMGFDYSCTKYKRLTHTFEPFEDQMDECKKKRTESEKSDCYYDVALRYARGEGVQEDTKKAARAFEASCEANNPLGCLFLGQMYYSGEGVLQDFRKSFEVFKRACRRANGFACERVGTQFYLGKGTTRDLFF